MKFIYKQKQFINLIQAFRWFDNNIPFKTFKYLIGQNSFYIILEFDSLPQNIDYLNENFYLISDIDIKHFLTFYHFNSLIHVDRNENIVNIYGFANYYNLFVTNLEENQSNINIDLRLLKETQELHLKFFCTDFIKNSLKVSEGDSVIFNIPNSDCFIKRFLNFLPKPIKKNLETTWDKNYEKYTVEFLEYLLLFIKFQKIYIPEYKCFFILNVKWIE